MKKNNPDPPFNRRGNSDLGATVRLSAKKRIAGMQSGQSLPIRRLREGIPLVLRGRLHSPRGLLPRVAEVSLLRGKDRRFHKGENAFVQACPIKRV